MATADDWHEAERRLRSSRSVWTGWTGARRAKQQISRPASGGLVCLQTAMQHRAHRPQLPRRNTFLQQKWDRTSYELHITKIKSAKATVDISPPKTFIHLSVKMKKQKLEAERDVEIQRENDKLADKISNIMRTTGRVDNRNDYERRSLGGEKRRQELLRITRENQAILLRLGRCRSEYGAACWREDWLKRLSVMDAIARYPRGGGALQHPSSKEHKGPSKRNRDREQSTQDPAGNQSNKSNQSRVETDANGGRTHTNEKQCSGRAEKSFTEEPAVS